MGFEDDSIISGQCPAGYCCQYEECEYTDDGDALCALYRDSNSLLCSECIDGYSESINSLQCVECEKGIHWKFVWLSMAIAVATTASILSSNADHGGDESPENCRDEVAGTAAALPALQRKATLKDVMLEKAKSNDTKLMLDSLVKIAVYYEQVWCK